MGFGSAGFFSPFLAGARLGFGSPSAALRSAFSGRSRM